MSRLWRLLVAALRYLTNGTEPPHDAVQFLPLAGIVVGIAGAGIYWLAAQMWPSSVAVILAMLTTVILTTPRSGAMGGASLLQVVLLIVKYNALMALSSAKLPFAIPENLTMGLILVAGEASSRALCISTMRTSHLAIALVFGALPGCLLGIPGLAGLGAALSLRLLASSWFAADGATGCTAPETTRQVGEICFYLAALATWRYA